MPIKLTLIGLGQIGTSFGLALSDYKAEIQRIGFDLDIGVARQAESRGAIDRVTTNFTDAVKDSNVVLVSIPANQLYDTLQIATPLLAEGCVLLETAHIKQAVFSWMEQLLPSGRSYVGLLPVINPVYLIDNKNGQDAARRDLFENGLMAIASPASTHPSAMQLAIDLARLVGSSPLFVDPLELDGFTSAIHNLPQLLSAALVESTSNAPSWRDSRKVAGRAYASSTISVGILDNAEALSRTAIENPENTIRVLKAVSDSILKFISDIERNDQAALEARLRTAQQFHQQWWKDRQSGDWLSMEGIPKVEYPTPSSIFARLLGKIHKTDES